MWLALGELDEAAAQALRGHLETCEECRRYLAEVSAVTTNLAAVEIAPTIETCASFHQRLTRKLRAERPLWTWRMFGAGQSIASWRFVFLSGSAAACLALLAILWRTPAPSHPRSTVSTAVPGPASIPMADLPPTFANYQMVANESLDKFDELLSQQGTKNPAPSGAYLASRTAE